MSTFLERIASNRPKRTKKLLFRYLKVEVAIVLFTIIMTIYSMTDHQLASVAFMLLMVTILINLLFSLYASISLRVGKIEEAIDDYREGKRRRSGKPDIDS